MMKKIFVVSMMLTVMMAAQAQLKVAPKMAKGTTKVYVSESTTAIPSQKDVHTTSETKFTVTAQNADGYTMEVVTTDVKSDAAGDNLAAKILSAAENLMKGLSVRLTTNKDGQVKSIQNYGELKQKIDGLSNELVDQLFEQAPMLAQAMSKDAMKQQILESTTEENLLKTMQNMTSPLALNGKTITTGSQEEYKNEQGMKMKRMYFVNGKNVTTNGSMNMSKDELKAMIIEKVEKLVPDQAELIKQNIDQVMATGMIKFESKETATYELQDDGWVKSIKTESTNEAMGQQMKTTTTVTIK